MDFAPKITEIQAELAAVEHDLEHAPPAGRFPLQARRASLQRSLRWYQSRTDTRIVHPLGVHVSEEIRTREAS
jgi:hypothetical protein